ncbi:hypothetical protein Taro_044234 [Colocasia esculenta]|uniref:Uncharacterized protein n=1 Tax=Colocasia esculenta TaxID=4460 RepID=A0A843X2A7_COLES|nr:hypothetical protein [Colocasia esculenta]
MILRANFPHDVKKRAVFVDMELDFRQMAEDTMGKQVELVILSLKEVDEDLKIETYHFKDFHELYRQHVGPRQEEKKEENKNRKGKERKKEEWRPIMVSPQNTMAEPTSVVESGRGGLRAHPQAPPAEPASGVKGRPKPHWLSQLQPAGPTLQSHQPIQSVGIEEG